MPDDITVLEGSESINRSNIGQPAKPADDQPQTIKSQSWKNSYVDPTRQPVHVLLYDGYWGVGGFKGDIDQDNDKVDKNNGAYSYLTPLGAHELQWRNRVKQTFLFNYFQRFINAKVKPVFSQSKIRTVSSLGGNVQEDDLLMQQFIEDCTGTGTPYEAMQEYFLTNLQVHDVAYHVMTKKQDADVPSLSEYRAIDLIYANIDDNNELNDIMFYNGTKEVLNSIGNQVRTVAKAIRFYMDGSTCKIQNYVSDTEDYILGNWSGDEDWKEDGEEIDTQVGEMVVYAQLTKAEPTGVYLPPQPRSMSLMNAQLGLYQAEGRYNWLYSIAMIPTFYIYGEMTGINLGAGQGISVPIQNQGSQLPAPNYVTIDSGLLSSGMDKVDFDLTRLREIAKENGVDTKTGAQAQSSDSKRFEFQATEQELRRSVNYCQTADEWIFYMFNLYTGRTDQYTYERTYPSSFYPEEEAELQELLDGIEVADRLGFQTTRNVVFRQYAMKLLGRSPSKEEMEEIEAEIQGSTIENAG